MTADEMSVAPSVGAAPPGELVVDKRAESLGYLLAQGVIKVLADRAGARAARLTSKRPDGTPLMDVGERESAFLAGRKLGATRMNAGAVRVIVDGADPQLVAWVKNHPKYSHNIREIVEPAFVNQLKAHAKKVLAPVDVHGDEIPGMVIDYGRPTPVQELADDFAEVIAAAIDAGELTLAQLLAPVLSPATPQLEEGPRS